MGLSGISKSTVSKLCKDIDERVGEFLNRPLTGDWLYVWLDATYLKQRQGGRIVSQAANSAGCSAAKSSRARVQAPRTSSPAPDWTRTSAARRSGTTFTEAEGTVFSGSRRATKFSPINLQAGRVSSKICDKSSP